MKTRIVLAFLCLIFRSGFAQPSGFEYLGKPTPTVSKEKLPFSKSIHNINPEFCRYLILPNIDGNVLDQRLNRQKIYLGCALPQYLKVTGSPQGNSNYVQQDFDGMVDYVSTEISTVSGGKARTAEGKSEQLSPEQNFILASADMSSEIRVKIKFRYKNDGSKVNEGEFATTVVPEHQAEFPGGMKSMADYLKRNITDKISAAGPAAYIPQIDVKFTVDEKGQVGEATVFNSNGDSTADKIIRDAIRKMPRWKAATNSKGIPAKQEFSLPFGSRGGC